MSFPLKSVFAAPLAGASASARTLRVSGRVRSE